jgi:hypothetical protein
MTPAEVNRGVLEFMLKSLRDNPADYSPNEARMLLTATRRVTTQLNRIVTPPKPRKHRAKR